MNLKKNRSNIRRSIFSAISFSNPKLVVEAKGEIGLENINTIKDFISLAKSTIDANSSELIIDLKKCTRIWPSTITLLCSLKKWTELACSVNGDIHPLIRSYSPEKKDVEEYLHHSGFYKYVAGINKSNSNIFPDGETVKIVREKDRSKIIYHETEIDKLIQQHSFFNQDQYELFTCKVLIEIVNNVTEHGVTCNDQGWWILAQYHKTHKIISICIADNGIGFRLNLTSGPQKKEIEAKLENVPNNDAQFILMGFTDNVSGAYNASTKNEGVFIKKYSKGARRGNGLKRILNTCKECGVQLSVLSHYGYVIFDNDGELLSMSASDKRLFAGTMYHLTVPAK